MDEMDKFESLIKDDSINNIDSSSPNKQQAETKVEKIIAEVLSSPSIKKEEKQEVEKAKSIEAVKDEIEDDIKEKIKQRVKELDDNKK